MRIGIEVQRLFRTKRFGIESSALELIKALRDLDSGNDFVVFVKDDVNKGLSPSKHVEVKSVRGKLFFDFEQVFLPMAARKERIDVLHCTGNTVPYFCPVPVVQTLHDVIFMDAIPSGDSAYQHFGNMYRRKLVPLVTPRSKAVITVSEYEKQRILQRINISPDRIHVIYNGVNTNRFHDNHPMARKEEVRQRYSLPEKYVLFLGNSSSRKNAKNVLEAYARYATSEESPLPLVAPGLSREYLSRTLSNGSHTLAEKLIRTPGYIDDVDLPLLYHLSTLFLFPSLSEGFGMPILEAMASGSPVITSNVSAMPEIAGDAAVLVNPSRPEEVSNAIQQVSHNDDLQKRMREAGLANIHRFSWRNSASQVLSLYEAVYAESRESKTRRTWVLKPEGSTRPWK
jgi:glycosyltransferase involved in cell wall biosynthesis